MAASTIIKHDTDGTIQLADGSTTPVVFTAPYTQGDFSITGIDGQGLREVVAYQSRGVLHSIRRAARTFPSISFSAMLSDLSDATDQTLYDFVRKTGSYNGNTTTSTASQEVYTLDVTLTIEGTDHGDAADHEIVCTDCAITFDLTEGQPTAMSFAGTVYGTVTAS
jgi:hypothetical protein